MNSFRGVFFVFFFFAVTTSLGVIFWTTLNTSKRVQLPNSASAQINVPQASIESLPPTFAVEGQTFTYRVVAKLDESSLTVEPLSKPDWLKWNSSERVLQGKVPRGIASFDVVVAAMTNSRISAKQEFTVTVRAAATVIGALVNKNEDPFHPVNGNSLVYSGSSEITPSTAVLGEKAGNTMTWDTTLIIIAVPSLLLFVCIILIYKIMRPSKRVVLVTDSGATIQTSHS